MKEIDITEEFDSWEDFELIARILQTKMNCQLLRRSDGPDARSWKFRFRETVFWLVHDDMIGNFISTEDESAVDILNKIVKELELIIYKEFRFSG